MKKVIRNFSLLVICAASFTCSAGENASTALVKSGDSIVSAVSDVGHVLLTCGRSVQTAVKRMYDSRGNLIGYVQSSIVVPVVQEFTKDVKQLSATVSRGIESALKDFLLTMLGLGRLISTTDFAVQDKTIPKVEITEVVDEKDTSQKTSAVKALTQE